MVCLQTLLAHSVSSHNVLCFPSYFVIKEGWKGWPFICAWPRVNFPVASYYGLLLASSEWCHSIQQTFQSCKLNVYYVATSVIACPHVSHPLTHTFLLRILYIYCEQSPRFLKNMCLYKLFRCAVHSHVHVYLISMRTTGCFPCYQQVCPHCTTWGRWEEVHTIYSW